MKTANTTTRNWSVNGLLEEIEDCWLFHQLFHHLRVPKDSRWNVLVDNLLGNRHKARRRNGGPPAVPPAAQDHRGSVPWERSRQAAPRCAAVNAPAAGRQRGGQAPTVGLFVKRQFEEIRLGNGFFRIVAVLFVSFPPPAPGLLLSPWVVWWSLSAKSIATVSRSCRKNWRDRRCRQNEAVC